MNNGLNNSLVKSQNSGLALKLVLTGAASTRIDVANALNLTKMTATNIIGAYIDNDVLVESPLSIEGKKGRPSIGLSLSPKAPKVIGIYLGKEYGLVGLFDLLGKSLRMSRVPFGNALKDDLLAKVFESVDDILRTSINERILGISISVNGSVDQTSGKLFTHANPELAGIEVKSLFADRYSLPTYVGDECENLATIEHYYGVASDHKDFVYVNIDAEIGSGTFLNGEPLRNSKGHSTCLGHLSIDYNGLSCTCGNRGCLQSYISTESMEKKLRDITKLKSDFQGFCEMQAKKNDSRVDWAFKDMMDKLGFAIISLSSIIHPSMVIIGGKGAHIPDRYLTRLEKAMSGKRINNEEETRVCKPKFEDKGREISCVSPILSEMFSGRLSII